jgi:hypothetical protein
MGWRLRTLINSGNFIFCLVLILLLGGCASKVVINPKYCKNKKASFMAGDERDFHFKIRKWSFFDFKNLEIVDLDEVLKSNKIECNTLKNINVSVEYMFIDAFVTLIPFVNAKTILFSGNRNE